MHQADASQKMIQTSTGIWVDVRDLTQAAKLAYLGYTPRKVKGGRHDQSS